MIKLIFDKNEESDITVQIQSGSNTIDFNYVEMLKELIQDNNIEYEWGNLGEAERIILRNMLDKIQEAVKTGLEKPMD